MKSLPENHLVVFFDGHCHLCDGLVQFLIDRDGHDRFRFAPMNEPNWRARLEAENLPVGETILVYDRGQWFAHDEAILRITEELPGVWRWFGFLERLPSTWRRSGYRWMATNRYKIFRKREHCRIPKPGEKAKFL